MAVQTGYVGTSSTWVVSRRLEPGAAPEATAANGHTALMVADRWTRHAMNTAVAVGPVFRMANLWWHRAGRRHLVMWRRAALDWHAPLDC